MGSIHHAGSQTSFCPHRTPGNAPWKCAAADCVTRTSVALDEARSGESGRITACAIAARDHYRSSGPVRPVQTAASIAAPCGAAEDAMAKQQRCGRLLARGGSRLRPSRSDAADAGSKSESARLRRGRTLRVRARQAKLRYRRGLPLQGGAAGQHRGFAAAWRSTKEYCRDHGKQGNAGASRGAGPKRTMPRRGRYHSSNRLPAKVTERLARLRAVAKATSATRSSPPDRGRQLPSRSAAIGQLTPGRSPRLGNKAVRVRFPRSAAYRAPVDFDLS